MRVLLQNRSGFTGSLAGDSVQLAKTKEYLEKLGVKVTVDTSPDLDLCGFDLVHLFNLIPVEDTYKQFQNAKKQGKKVVLSTIYWNPGEYLEKTGQKPRFQNWWEATQPLRKELLAEVDLILPNSRLELEALQRDYSRLARVLIVPNAADRSFTNARPDRFHKKNPQIPECVLSVGRICRLKNQLSLIKATKDLKLPLVLIGPLNDGSYYQECRRAAAGEQVWFFDTMNQAELASAYAWAKVHALVSWYDIPGLVSLEAALAGCRVVTTNRGNTRDYFQELAYYCDPEDPSSIKGALRLAWTAPRQSNLTAMVNLNFTWEKTAALTRQAYELALKPEA